MKGQYLRKRKSEAAFTIIELLVVMAIILVIVAIAVPNYLAARTRSLEVSALASIKAVNSAEWNYATLCPALGYSSTIAKLGPGAGDCNAANVLLDTALLAGSRGNYTFTYTPGTPNGAGVITSFTYKGLGPTSSRAFCSDGNMIFVNMAGTSCSPATDPVLQ